MMRRCNEKERALAPSRPPALPPSKGKVAGQRPPAAGPLPTRRRIVSILVKVSLFIVGYLIGDGRRQAQNDACRCPEITASIAQNQETAAASVEGERNKMRTMDWEIPSDIREERHKECEGRKISSTGGFCLTKTRRIGGNWWVDKPLGEYLRDNLFHGMNVVDLGAGMGHYGKIFTEEGSPVKSWVGFDGAMNVQDATDGLVRFMDLTQPHPADERPCSPRGDWVLSLEVAEHIPPAYTDHYIRNLRCSCAVGAVVSWARPAQTGGLGHVNTKEEKDAIAAMSRWGFVVDQEASRSLKNAASMDHFKTNTIVYRVKT